LDRSPGATILRSGARLLAALLPLAAVGILRNVPSLQTTPLPWVGPAVAATAAVLAGLALLVAVAAALEDGLVRDLADLAGLGILVAALSVVAFDAAGPLGLGIGLASASAALLAGSLFREWSLAARRERVVALVIAVVAIDAALAVILLSPGWNAADKTGTLLSAGAAVVMALAALAGLDNAARATGLGIAASSAAAFAIGAASGNEAIIGSAGLAVAALVLGSGLLVERLHRAPVLEPAATLPQLTAAPEPEPEHEELSRITRELRATLDDLVAARHLIELQRVEIDRVSTIDQLTGLTSRWPTLDRLRTEAAEARRYTHPVAVVLLDIDHFADLNHEHGLDVGDAVLREIALRLRIRMREADAVGRIGADAFLAILPHTDEGGATTFANAVLDRLLERRVITDRGEIKVSLSVGIALMRPGMRLSGEELLASAEDALASARAAGGNRIAFDRLHGLARLDERSPGTATPAENAEENR
jgi:diguanylate cyclase (GGDEF)-like protein